MCKQFNFQMQKAHFVCITWKKPSRLLLMNKKGGERKKKLCRVAPLAAELMKGHNGKLENGERYHMLIVRLPIKWIYAEFRSSNNRFWCISFEFWSFNKPLTWHIFYASQKYYWKHYCFVGTDNIYFFLDDRNLLLAITKIINKIYVRRELKLKHLITRCKPCLLCVFACSWTHIDSLQFHQHTSTHARDIIYE